ncbi:uncharacterized protein Ttc19 isoform X2 [Tenebrio molitor]|jgi:hypothetical protein|uniref:uncharacterized protein Ttc19 isoform X2 n=1 Tax=Tenebrio molitor TaxID=7067 RepID=UPI003624824C
MGKFCSVLVASLQYLFTIYVFKKPDLTGCGPLISSLTVLLAVSLILWSLPLYPRRLRKLMTGGNCLAQYLIAVFLIEYIMGCFWFPLEAAVLALLPKTASIVEQFFAHHDIVCHLPCDFLKREGTGMFISYFLSFLILLAAMHATRIINLKLLASGITPFIHDVTRRLQRFSKSLPFNIGFPKLNKKRSRKRDYCTTDEDFETELDALPDEDYQYAYR